MFQNEILVVRGYHPFQDKKNLFMLMARTFINTKSHFKSSPPKIPILAILKVTLIFP